MTVTHHPVDLIAADGSITRGEFVIADKSLIDPDLIELTLIVPGRRWTASAADCFEALILIRLELELLEVKLLCWGASLQVYPSEMSRSMGLGDIAYRLTLGQFARSIDQVNIFEAGPGLVAATVAEQEDYSRAWFDSLATPGKLE